jgi:hypothetical protein
VHTNSTLRRPEKCIFEVLPVLLVQKGVELLATRLVRATLVLQPSRSPKAPPGLLLGVEAPGVEDALEAVGVPQSPALAFCLAMSAMVTFWVGVLVFLGATPPSNEAKASPPDFEAAEAGLLPKGEKADGVLPVEDGALLATGTDVK